jgi:RNA polymerase sigma-70 factor (ECF subfamily)
LKHHVRNFRVSKVLQTFLLECIKPIVILSNGRVEVARLLAGEAGQTMKPQRATVTRRAEFDALYRQYSREVWALAFGRSTDADLAMDVTQEAFLRLWRQLEDGEVIDNPRAWLMRVARNLAEDQAKSAFRRNGTQSPELMNGVGSDSPSPLDKLVRDEAFALIRTLLEKLTPTDREILTFRYALDYDAPTIADLLGVNIAAVHMRLSRARQRLAEMLAAEGVQTSP